LLLLDEPTNHLDIDMRHALTVALQSFEGGLVVVSHDRHLIKTVADTLWLVADGKLTVFDGDLDDYQQWLKERTKRQQEALLRPKAAKLPRDPSHELKRELERIERKLMAIAREQALLDAAAAQSGTGSRHDEQRARLARDAATLEERWLEVGTALESSATNLNP